MTSVLAAAWVGTVINELSDGKFFARPDQKSGFVLPEKLRSPDPTPTTSATTSHSCSETSSCSGTPTSSHPPTAREKDIEQNIEGATDVPVMDPVMRMLSQGRTPSVKNDGSHVVVGWYDDKDPENPRNWSSRKKAFVTFIVSVMTFGVYTGSAIYTPSIPGVMEAFGVGLPKATLGLSLFVLGYAVGPMFLSPLSELASVGRNWTYIPSMFVFVMLNIGASLAPNFSTLMAMRFLTGFFGSPALATGGASLSDMYDGVGVAFPISIWAIGAVCGPVLGPVIGGFSAQHLGWRWPLWLLTILSGVTTATLALFLPETLEANILLKRARRLRKLTGDDRIRSQSELDSAAVSAGELVREALLRPLIIMIEPVVFFTSIYLGIAYACFYLFFESFPIVFTEMHGFNLGVSGLPFLGLAVSGVITLFAYMWYLKAYFNPRFVAKAEKGIIIPEDRLALALFASFFVPISLFGFGWTSSPDIHWIVPIIFASLLLPGVFLLFQSLLVYLPMSYPKYAASVLAANDLIRSAIAAAFPLFGHGMFTNLGVGVGCSVLGGIFIALIVPLWGIKRYGHLLRKHSKYAHVY